MDENLRRLFPVTKHHVYLNHAAVAPISIPVYEKMQSYARDLLEHGFVHFERWLAEVRRVRDLCARLINARPHEIAFAPNTSAGLSMIANGMDWRAGDNIVTADCEFPANVQPWMRIRRELGVDLRMARERDGRLEVGEIIGLIDDRTRAVSLSFVEFGSGFRNDLAAVGRVCRDRDILFIVDGIQGLGALDLDVEACCIDALSADAHKFLLGSDGCALLYVSERAIERIKPTLVGWLSVRSPEEYLTYEQPYVAGARRFEPGALNTAGVVGLGASVELFLEYGMPAIEKYLVELTDYLSDRLTDRGYRLISSRRDGEKSAVVCCRHDRFPAEMLHRHLEERQIITTPRLGRLRISPHFYNTRDEIDQLIDHLP